MGLQNLGKCAYAQTWKRKLGDLNISRFNPCEECRETRLCDRGCNGIEILLLTDSAPLNLVMVFQSFLPILRIPVKSQLIGFLPTSKMTRCVSHLRQKKLLQKPNYNLLGWELVTLIWCLGSTRVTVQVWISGREYFPKISYIGILVPNPHCVQLASGSWWTSRRHVLTY